MDKVQKVLFGSWPRSVGSPHQFWVFDEPSMDAFLERTNGEKNVYASISRFGQDGTPMTSMISFDLDTPVKDVAFPDTEAEDTRIMMMREDDTRAYEVLSTVVEDSEKVAKHCKREDIPMVAVFTGFGIHIHLLYKEEPAPKKELSSTVHYMVDQLELSTVDRKPIGDTSRLLRVPNCQRTYDGRSCSLWTIPLTADELIRWDPPDLLEKSLEPRLIDIPDMERPKMEVKEGYVASETDEPVEMEPLQMDPPDMEEDWVRWYLKETLQMPCMYQRLMQNDPGHMVRLNSAVMLFNYGFGPEDVYQMFRRLNWNDWDGETTKKQLRQIYRKGYADMSCETLQKQGLCVFEQGERKESCKTFGWRGGANDY